jgi:hypothetical protein
MIGFEDIDNIPNYIKGRICLPIVPFEKATKIISCKPYMGILNNHEIQNIINSYKDNTDKIIYIFLITDNCNKFTIPQHIRLYRTSLYRSQLQTNEYVLPYIWEGVSKSVPPLKKGGLPIVGFCGQNSTFRRRTLQLFNFCKQIRSNFIIRQQFWGGKPNDPTLIREYENNMINSHFNICNRGNGNFSMRFYQTLSCGRIPILLNTDIKLPFEDEIKWGNIIVSGNTEEELVRNLLRCWYTKNIVEMQINCKKIYNKYFSNSKYFDKILTI